MSSHAVATRLPDESRTMRLDGRFDRLEGTPLTTAESPSTANRIRQLSTSPSSTPRISTSPRLNDAETSGGERVGRPRLDSDRFQHLPGARSGLHNAGYGPGLVSFRHLVCEGLFVVANISCLTICCLVAISLEGSSTADRSLIVVICVRLVVNLGSCRGSGAEEKL